MIGSILIVDDDPNVRRFLRAALAGHGHTVSEAASVAEALQEIAALDAGADDYLTKPFSAGELMARIRVALRHATALGAGDEPVVLEVGTIRIDQPRHEVTVEGRVVRLTPIEFKILVALARQSGRVFTHRQLVHAVWGASAADQSHTLRVHVAALRRKIERDPARPRWFVTEAGVGYRLRESSNEATGPT